MNEIQKESLDYFLKMAQQFNHSVLKSYFLIKLDSKKIKLKLINEEYDVFIQLFFNKKYITDMYLEDFFDLKKLLPEYDISIDTVRESISRERKFNKKDLKSLT